MSEKISRVEVFGVAVPLVGGGFKGRIYAINPNYREIEGIACFPSLSALPEAVDHALLGVANVRLEAALQEAVPPTGPPNAPNVGAYPFP